MKVMNEGGKREEFSNLDRCLESSLEGPSGLVPLHSTRYRVSKADSSVPTVSLWVVSSS